MSKLRCRCGGAGSRYIHNQDELGICGKAFLILDRAPQIVSLHCGKASLWKSLPKPPPSLPQASPKPPPSLLDELGICGKASPSLPSIPQAFPKPSPSLPKPPRSNPKHSPSLPKPPQAFPQEELRPAVCACVCVCVCVNVFVCVCVCASLSGSLWANYIHN